jgi:putative NADPH-quinone reductase
MEKACKVLVVLADTQGVEDQSILRKCAGEFCVTAIQEQMELEFVDLYTDSYRSSQPLMLDHSKKTDRIIDYQMQLRSADWVVFFYQTVLGSMPGHLKSYLDAVIAPGVAFSSTNSLETFLDEKQVAVYIFEPKSQMESQLFTANREDFFWKRMIFRTTGMKGDIKQFFNTEKIDGTKIDKILAAIHSLVSGYKPVLAHN